MAQLTDDCFAFGGPLMTTGEARALLDARLAPIAGIETVPLAEALGRILADDLVAPIAVPPHANAAVDGYAIYFDDLSPDTETRLRVVGRAAAGHPADHTPARGEAVRIFTGAPMPAGPDTVMMQEDCRVEAGTVMIRPGIKRGANFRAAGEDVRAGGVEPRRFVPKGKMVVLGLVTTKRPQLESGDDLKRRIDEAAKYVPLDQICLSGQCGFSSTVEGNALTYDQQVAKLRLIVETARDIWG